MGTHPLAPVDNIQFIPYCWIIHTLPPSIWTLWDTLSKWIDWYIFWANTSLIIDSPNIDITLNIHWYLQLQIKIKELLRAVRSSWPIFSTTMLQMFLVCKFGWSKCKKLIFKIFCICPQVNCYLTKLHYSLLQPLIELKNDVTLPLSHIKISSVFQSPMQKKQRQSWRRGFAFLPLFTCSKRQWLLCLVWFILPFLPCVPTTWGLVHAMTFLLPPSPPPSLPSASPLQ